MRTVVFSELNPFRFVPLDAVYKYNTRHFDDDWFRNQILDWQTKTQYTQKVQRGDRVYLQILSTVAPTIEIYSCTQTDPVFTASYEDTGFTIGADTVYQANISEDFSALADGTYYIVTTIVDDDVTQSWITEPIGLADKWLGTMLLRYKNRYNKDHADFERTGAAFNMRVESALIDFEPVVNRVTYEKQDGDMALLSAVPARAFTWVAGGNGKLIPDYMISKLNHVWALDSVWLDGKKFVAAEGAALEKASVARFPKYSAGIEVREAYNNMGVVYSSGGFDVFTVPAYPFVIERYSLGRLSYMAGMPIPVLEFTHEQFAYIGDSDDLDAWITMQNTLVLPGEGFDGELALDGDKVVYSPAQGETFNIGTASLLTLYMSFTQTVPAGTLDSRTTVQMAGAGAVYVLVRNGSVVQSGYLTSSVTSVQLRGAPDSTHQFRLFHKNLITTMIVTDSGDTEYTAGTLTAFSGSASSNLTNLWVFGCNSLTTFSMATTYPARTSLTSLRIQSCASLTSVTNFHTSGQPSYTALSTILLNGNAMTTSTVNAFFNSMYSAMTDPTVFTALRFRVYGGTVNTRQATPAAPSSSSVVARAALIGSPYSWTVLTD